MNKTPKLKSRSLGLRSRSRKGTALSFKENDCDNNIRTKDLLNNSRHGSKEYFKTSNMSEYKHDDTLDMDEGLFLKGCRSSGMVTPVKTQKLPSCDEESPDIKDDSPDLQSNISTTFGSPDIEVSWDYSCSQAPKGSVDAVPRIKYRRRRFSKALPPLFNLHPHLLPDREMSEEERKKKIDGLKGFYAELFNNDKDLNSQTSTKTAEDISIDVTKENIPIFIHSSKCDMSKMKTQSVQGQYEDQMSSFFNDSSNDIILQCTQAVEEEIFKYSQAVNLIPKSDINMNSSNYEKGNEQSRYQNQGCIKRGAPEEYSTIEINENLERFHNSNRNKTPNSETRRRIARDMEDINSFFDDSIDEIMVKCSQDVEEELLSQESKNKNTGDKVNSKKHSASPLVNCSKAIKTNYKQSVNEQSSVKNQCNSNKLNSWTYKQGVGPVTKVNGLSSKVNLNIPKVTNAKHFSSHITFSRPKELQTVASETTKHIDNDITALLNDDDAYLTSIDFSVIDTVCAIQKPSATVSTTSTQSKIYSQHEIEAKRIEALNKLRRKRGKLKESV